VNAIKQREEFRPFAPVIMEEHAKDYFANIKHDQRFMQWTNECLYPEDHPAIIHVDGTSRVQTVSKDFSTIRFILEEWYNRTGCPMLLNTSLNIKGEPLVNDWGDAEKFGRTHKVKVF
jgi:carbamoyltransferase